MILEKIMIGAGILLVHFLSRATLFDITPTIRPDFMFIFIMFFALRKGGLAGLWIGFIGGLLLDMDLGEEDGVNGIKYYKLGLHAMSYSLVGYILGKFGRNLYNESVISVSVTAFILTLFARGLTYLLFTFFFHDTANYSFFATAVYNCVIAPIFFYVLSWVYRMDSSEVHE